MSQTASCTSTWYPPSFTMSVLDNQNVFLSCSGILPMSTVLPQYHTLASHSNEMASPASHAIPTSQYTLHDLGGSTASQMQLSASDAAHLNAAANHCHPISMTRHNEELLDGQKLPLNMNEMSVNVEDYACSTSLIQKKICMSDYRKSVEEFSRGVASRSDRKVTGDCLRKIERDDGAHLDGVTHFVEDDVKVNLAVGTWLSNDASQQQATSFSSADGSARIVPPNNFSSGHTGRLNDLAGVTNAQSSIGAPGAGLNNGLLRVAALNVPQFNVPSAPADPLRTAPARFAAFQPGHMPSFCQVCQDVAAGYHCGCYVCEACKKFFVRSAKGANVKYSCANSGQCMVTRATRTRCQYCRYQKCLQLGMMLPGEKQGAQTTQQESPVSETPCRVCAAPSSGFHFGAITCEGCKGFFRRSVKEREPGKYICPKNGTCEITQTNRNVCKHCRFKKCISVGMDPNASRIGRQPATSKVRLITTGDNTPSTSQTLKGDYGKNVDGSITHVRCFVPSSHVHAPVTSFAMDGRKRSSLTQSSIEVENSETDEEDDGENSQENDNNEDDDYENFADSNLSETTVTTVTPQLPISSARWTAADFDDNPIALARIERHICDAYIEELCRVHTKADGAIVHRTDDRVSLWKTMMKQFSSDAIALTSFSKRLPFFNLLATHDKLALVTSGMYPVCQILLSKDFDLENGDYNYFNYDRNERSKIFETFPSFKKLEEHFFRMRMIREMKLDPTEYALCCALQIFTVDGVNGVQSQVKDDGVEYDIDLVLRIRQHIASALKRYCQLTGKGLERYHTLIIKMTSFRMLTIEHHTVVNKLRRTNPDLPFPELYVEMFNISRD